MIKKRLIGVITVQDGWAVQSIGYKRYMPLGRPELLVQNLDRWGVDEILVQCIDRSINGFGPDFDLLRKIDKLGISTPLIYAGGIRGSEDARKVILCGADRIMVDSILYDSPYSLEYIARELGTQAIIANIPLGLNGNVLKALNYRNKCEHDILHVLDRLPHEWISEILITDWKNEGTPSSFNRQLINISNHIDKPIICFGGISEPLQIKDLLKNSNIVAIGIGNFLNYSEHAVQKYKQQLNSSDVREPIYESTLI